jgi:PqqD family protein of HPr-rel-A system
MVADLQQWQAVSPDGWRWAQWEESYSLFHPETGDTHILTELAALVLQSVSDAPRTTAGLCALTAEMCEIEADAQWRSGMCALLSGLEELELLERRSNVQGGRSPTCS